MLAMEQLGVDALCEWVCVCVNMSETRQECKAMRGG